MTIVLNGTTGITNDGGYTGDGVVFADTTPANTLVTTTGGNVGIGTSSPSSQLDVYSTIAAPTAGEAAGVGSIRITNGASALSSAGGLEFKIAGDTGGYGAKIQALNSGGAQLVFANRQGGSGWTERARITSSGNLLVGTESDGGGAGTLFSSAKGGTSWHFGPAVVGSGNNFYVLNASNAGVYLASGNTSWTANSDERLKTTLTPFENAAEKVCTLRAGTGRYLVDDEAVSRSFLIAQDVQAVLPEAVTVNPDEIGTLGLQYTEMIPLLVAAIQEQQAIILAQEAALTALTARVAALEGTQP